jgi:hypothetical protein
MVKGAALTATRATPRFPCGARFDQRAPGTRRHHGASDESVPTPKGCGFAWRVPDGPVNSA